MGSEGDSEEVDVIGSLAEVLDRHPTFFCRQGLLRTTFVQRALLMRLVPFLRDKWKAN